MNVWMKRGLQTALLTGGLLAVGSGIASADDGIDVAVPVSVTDNALAVLGTSPGTTAPEVTLPAVDGLVRLDLATATALPVTATGTSTSTAEPLAPAGAGAGAGAVAGWATSSPATSALFPPTATGTETVAAPRSTRTAPSTAGKVISGAVVPGLVPRTASALSVTVTGTATSMLSSAEAMPEPTARRPPVSRAVCRPRFIHTFMRGVLVSD